MEKAAVPPPSSQQFRAMLPTPPTGLAMNYSNPKILLLRGLVPQSELFKINRRFAQNNGASTRERMKKRRHQDLYVCKCTRTHTRILASFQPGPSACYRYARRSMSWFCHLASIIFLKSCSLLPSCPPAPLEQHITERVAWRCA